MNTATLELSSDDLRRERQLAWRASFHAIDLARLAPKGDASQTARARGPDEHRPMPFRRRWNQLCAALTGHTPSGSCRGA